MQASLCLGTAMGHSQGSAELEDVQRGCQDRVWGLRRLGERGWGQDAAWRGAE